MTSETMLASSCQFALNQRENLIIDQKSISLSNDYGDSNENDNLNAIALGNTALLSHVRLYVHFFAVVC